MLLQMTVFHSFLWLSNFPLYACRPHRLYPSICWWLVGCLLVLAVVNMWTLQRIWESSYLFDILILLPSGVYPEARLQYLMIVLFFTFLRNLHTVFNSDCTDLHSQQVCTWSRFSPHPYHHMVCLVFFVIFMLTGIRWYLTEVLIYVSLTISGNSVRLYFGGLQNHCRWWLQPWN